MVFSFILPDTENGQWSIIQMVAETQVVRLLGRNPEEKLDSDLSVCCFCSGGEQGLGTQKVIYVCIFFFF